MIYQGRHTGLPLREVMTYDPDKHHRRSIRLPGYDYAQAGAYFVTVCTQDRRCLFGSVVNGDMSLNGAGHMVEKWWAVTIVQLTGQNQYQNWTLLEAVEKFENLLKLPAEVQTYVRDGLLSSGHAKVILGLKHAKDQIAAAKRVIKKELSVRQTEELLGALGQATPGKTKRGATGKSTTADAHILDLESKLQERLGTKVSLRYRKGKGSVDIRFFNDEDLQRILETLGIKAD